MSFARKATSPAIGAKTASGLRSKLPSDAETTFTVMRMNLGGSHNWDHIADLEPTGGVSNYLRGTGPSTWLKGIRHYAELRAPNVYDGVDLVFYGSGPSLKYDFILKPGTDPKQIRLAFDGVRDLRVEKTTGDLVLRAADDSEVRQLRPRMYQEAGNKRVEVAGGYRIVGPHSARFSLAEYDHAKPLIIDPRLDATENSATFLGKFHRHCEWCHRRCSGQFIHHRLHHLS
jgi:hypothetical protein